MKKSVNAVFGILLLLSACAAPPSTNRSITANSDGTNPHAVGSSKICLMNGQWLDPATGTGLDGPALIAAMARRGIVLLGEIHNNADHHRWQLQTIAALYTRNPNMVLAFETFPRRVQPVLDRWVNGKLNEKNFLKQVDWNDIWRFDSSLYLPLFNFARMNRVPMIAMNVDRGLTDQVSKVGWNGVAKDLREGVGDPAPASKDYIDFLAKVFSEHGNKKKPVKSFGKSPRFKRFIQAQLTWDRAMAEAMARAHNSPGHPLVVGIVGMGHLQYGYGIPYQLADLGINDAAVLLPWDSDRDCKNMLAGNGSAIADAVFGIATPKIGDSTKKASLGVRIKSDKSGGLKIKEVAEKSVAKAAGFIVGDIVFEAAGRPVSKPSELIAIIHRQAAGTWLPMKIRRNRKILELIAKFPPKT